MPNPLAMLANPATFLCEICYCNVKRDETVRSCAAGHRWCRDCLGAYVRSQVQDHNLKVGCPHISGDQRCENVLSEQTVLDLLDDEMKARHVTWQPRVGIVMPAAAAGPRPLVPPPRPSPRIDVA